MVICRRRREISMKFYNETTVGSTELAPVKKCLTLIVITCLAVLTNSSFIVLACAIRPIRIAISSVFFVSLCCVDLIGSIAVLILAASSLVGQKWGDEKSRLGSHIYGGVQLFTRIVSVLTIVLMSFEKYVYIKYPLSHEEYISMKKSVVSLIVIWMTGIFVTALPGFGFAEYLPTSGIAFTVKWKTFELQRVFAIVECLFLFAVPLVILLVISVLLYRVVKQARIAVGSQPNPLRSRNVSASNGRDYSQVFVVNVSDANNRECMTDPSVTTRNLDTTAALFCSDVNPTRVQTECTKSHVTSFSINSARHVLQKQSSSVRIENNKVKVYWKPFALLTMPLCYFIVVWLPVSIQGILAAYGVDDSHHYVNLEIFSFILMYSSYAMNPIFYGFMSKTFRQESVHAIKSCCCPDNDIVRPFSVVRSQTDFLQFLHRTSSSAAMIE